MSNQSYYISIAGLIGAGKSTLAQSLSDILKLPMYKETVEDNPVLAEFYKDQKEHAFHLQMDLLFRRFDQQQRIFWSGGGGVQDRTIYEDCIFSHHLTNSGLMSELQLSTYLKAFDSVSAMMCKPSVIIYLEVTPEVALERIRERGREIEKNITLEYLQSLSEAYSVFLECISRNIPVITLDWNQPKKPEDLAPRILDELEKLRGVHKIRW